MGKTLNPDGEHPYVETPVNLTGGGTVTFDAPDTESLDTPEEHPVQFWLNTFPTATEGPPD